MNSRAVPFNTKYLEHLNSIRERGSNKIKLNTELHQQSRCCFALHEIVDVEPDSINVIPGEVSVTYGFRDPDAETLREAERRVRREAEAAAEREGVAVEHENRADAAPVSFDERCVTAVQRAADDRGYDAMEVFSGGVHDATHAAEVCETGMVFAVSEDGKSHTEAEYTDWDDCYSAADTLARAALALADDEL